MSAPCLFDNDYGDDEKAVREEAKRMNISDAAREAAEMIWRTTYGSHVVPCVNAAEIIEQAINTATAALTLELETVRQQLAEAREDSRRLDWLEENGDDLMTTNGKWVVMTGRCMTATEGGVRGAIDAAINTLNPPTDEK